MPPIEIGSALPIGAIGTKLTGAATSGSPRTERNVSAKPATGTSDALDPGAPPVDVDRVQVIRKAIESKTYPVLPAKIADAIIAAGLLLRNGE